MMVIRIYDFEFNLIYIASKYISSSWRINFNDTGTFEAHFPLESEIASVINENKYLVAIQGEFAAIITGYDMKDDFAVFGRTCNWILKKRITLPFKTTDYAENIVCEAVGEAFADTDIFLAENGEVSDRICYVTESAKTTFDVVKECMNLVSGGHEVSFDLKQKKWIFKTLKSKESELIISEAMKNANETAITRDILDFAECGYYNTGYTDMYGYDELEMVSAESGKEGIYRWEELLKGRCKEEAESALSEKKENNTLTLKTYGLLYGVDYKLGDIVRVQVKKGTLRRTGKRKVSGLEIRYQNGVKFEQPVLEEV